MVGSRVGSPTAGDEATCKGAQKNEANAAAHAKAVALLVRKNVHPPMQEVGRVEAPSGYLPQERPRRHGHLPSKCGESNTIDVGFAAARDWKWPPGFTALR